MSLADQIQWQPDIEPSGNYYDTPDGRFPRITHVLDTVLGFGKHNMNAKAASLEKERDIQAARDAYYQAVVAREHRGKFVDADEFEKDLRSRCPGLHYKKVWSAKADVGTEIHEAIQRYRKGDKIGAISGPATVSFQAAVKYMESRQLEPVRTEKSGWTWWQFEDETHGFGCTLDCVDLGPDGYEVNEWKSSKSIYESYHSQVGGQVLALKRSGIQAAAANIIRLPQSLDDPLLKGEGIEVIPAGRIYVYDEKRWIDRPLSRLMLAARQCVELYYLCRGE